MAKYYNKAHMKISLDRWVSLTADESYAVLKRFENDQISIIARWHGKVDDRQSIEPGYGAPMFYLDVQNIMINTKGVPVKVRDTELSSYYESEPELLKAYEAAVLSWTESVKEVEMDAEGNPIVRVVEVGNKFAPPDPEELMVEEIVNTYTGNTDAGSW